MTREWEYPQLSGTGYVDDDNGMYQLITSAENVDCSCWLDTMMVSITEPAEGGTAGVIRFQFGNGDGWFELPAHTAGVTPFDFGENGQLVCPFNSDGLQMISTNATTKQAKAWVTFMGHRKLQQ